MSRKPVSFRQSDLQRSLDDVLSEALIRLQDKPKKTTEKILTNVAKECQRDLKIVIKEDGIISSMNKKYGIGKQQVKVHYLKNEKKVIITNGNAFWLHFAEWGKANHKKKAYFTKTFRKNKEKYNEMIVSSLKKEMGLGE